MREVHNGENEDIPMLRIVLAGLSVLVAGNAFAWEGGPDRMIKQKEAPVACEVVKLDEGDGFRAAWRLFYLDMINAGGDACLRGDAESATALNAIGKAYYRSAALFVEGDKLMRKGPRTDEIAQWRARVADARSELGNAQGVFFAWVDGMKLWYAANEKDGDRFGAYTRTVFLEGFSQTIMRNVDKITKYLQDLDGGFNQPY